MRKRARSGGVGAALCGLVLLACAGAAPAESTWSKPERITPPYAVDTKVAIDARGLTLVTWGQRTGYGPQLGRFSYRWRAPGGRLSPIRTTDGVVPDYGSILTMTPHGDALVAYGDRSNELVYRTAPAGGTFSSPRRLGAPGEKGLVHLAADDAGNAVAAWSRLSDGAIRVATRRVGGDFGPAETLDARTGEQYATSSKTEPAVAVNTAGAAFIAWQAGQEQDAAGRYFTRYRTAYRPPAGSFGSPAPAPRFAQEVQYDHLVAMTEGGDAVMTSQDFPSNETSATTYAVRGVTGGWSDVHEVGRMGHVTNLFAEPGGSVSFVIERIAADRSRRYVDFATRLPDGTLVGPSQLSTEDGMIPHAAMSLRGDLLAAWVAGDFGTAPVVIADRLAGSAFGPPAPLSPRGAWSPHVAVNDARQAAIAWDYDADPSGEYAPAGWGAFRFDPELPPLPLPPDIDIGTPLDPILDENGIAVPVECDRDCTVQPGGLLVGALTDARRSKNAGNVKLRKGDRRRIRVRFGAAERTAARKALARGRHPWVSLTVRAKGKSPRAVRVSRRVKLR